MGAGKRKARLAAVDRCLNSQCRLKNGPEADRREAATRGVSLQDWCRDHHTRGMVWVAALVCRAVISAATSSGSQRLPFV